MFHDTKPEVPGVRTACVPCGTKLGKLAELLNHGEPKTPIGRIRTTRTRASPRCGIYGNKPMAANIELWEVNRLVPSAHNARTHSDSQVAEIAGSIVAFGFMVPVLVDSAGVIIAGHGRVLAARKLNLEKVPVIVADHLTDAEKRAAKGRPNEQSRTRRRDSRSRQSVCVCSGRPCSSSFWRDQQE